MISSYRQEQKAVHFISAQGLPIIIYLLKTLWNFTQNWTQKHVLPMLNYYLDYNILSNWSNCLKDCAGWSAAQRPHLDFISKFLNLFLKQLPTQWNYPHSERQSPDLGCNPWATQRCPPRVPQAVLLSVLLKTTAGFIKMSNNGHNYVVLKQLLSAACKLTLFSVT